MERVAKIAITAVALLFLTLASCQDKAKMNFSVEVVDDEGKPVPACEAGAIIFDAATGKYRRTAKMTDAKGIAYFSLLSGHSRLSCGAKAPDGYYWCPGVEFFYGNAKNGIWQPENKRFKMVLKRKKNPIAMYAKKAPYQIPAKNREVGYDLEVGDWVRPYGKGKISDLIFHHTVKLLSHKEFDSSLKITFSNKGDGLIPFEAPIEGEAEQFRSDYYAPEGKYVGSLVHTWVRKPGMSDKNTRKRTMNYYIRVRTKLDKKGRVISAHYGKVYGDFMKFTHYLNPTPNDRNVEFDPKKNLIDTGSRGFKVQQP